jgi:hypothetical protein
VRKHPFTLGYLQCGGRKPKPMEPGKEKDPQEEANKTMFVYGVENKDDQERLINDGGGL